MRFRLILFILALFTADIARAADAAEIAFWQSVEAGGTRADYQAYLERYPDGDFAALARNRIGGAGAPRDERAFLSSSERRAAQAALTRSGYDTRGVDGVFGRGTRAAIRSWQAAEGFVATGFLTPNQYAVLLAAEPVVRVSSNGGENDAWAQAKRENTAFAYEAFLDRYPNGRHAAKARKRLANRDLAAERKSREQVLGLNRRQREEVEERLAFAGFYPGAIDGRFTRDTRKAVRSFRRTRGLAEHGFVDRPMLRQLVNETGGGGRRGQGEDYSDAAVGLAAGALLLGGILIIAD